MTLHHIAACSFLKGSHGWLASHQEHALPTLDLWLISGWEGKKEENLLWRVHLARQPDVHCFFFFFFFFSHTNERVKPVDRCTCDTCSTKDFCFSFVKKTVIAITTRVAFMWKRKTRAEKKERKTRNQWFSPFLRWEAARVRRLRQRILDQQLAQHSPADPQRREASPVPGVRQALHRLVQPLLPPHDAHQGMARSASEKGREWIPLEPCDTCWKLFKAEACESASEQILQIGLLELRYLGGSKRKKNLERSKEECHVFQKKKKKKLPIIIRALAVSYLLTIGSVPVLLRGKCRVERPIWGVV